MLERVLPFLLFSRVHLTYILLVRKEKIKIA